MTRIGIFVALCVATVAAAASARSDATGPPVGALATCATQSTARFPGAFTSPRNLVVGPFVLVGAGGTPSFSESFGGQKFPLLVSMGHRVTVALPAQAREDGAGLGYGPLPQGEVGVRDAHRVVTFVACARGRAGSTASGRAVTFWSGGLLARSPRCVPLLLWIDGARSPVRVVVHLGVDRCTAGP